MTSTTAVRAARNLARVPEASRAAVVAEAARLQEAYGYGAAAAVLVAAGQLVQYGSLSGPGARAPLLVDGVSVEAGNMDMDGVNPLLAGTRHVAAITASAEISDGPKYRHGRRREVYALLVTGAVTARVTEIAGVPAYYGPDEVIGHRDATSGPEAAGRELIAIARSRGLSPES